MRFKVNAEAETLLKVPGTVREQHGDFEIELIPDAKGVVASVSVSKEVPDYQEYLPSLQTAEDGPHHLRFPGGDFVDDLVELLQHLESLGSFWLNILKVHWEDPEFEWVPETADEESKLEVRTLGRSYSFSDEPKQYQPRLLFETLKNRTDNAYLVIPMAFYREGMNEHNRLRFIQAFFNFYFFLEGLYAGGKTKNYHVEREFLSSKDLEAAAEKAIEDIRNFTRRPDHFESIELWLGERDLHPTPDGILKLLVRMRGTLHHYSLENSGRTGHPLNQRAYESLSFLTMTICVNVIVKLVSGGKPE